MEKEIASREGLEHFDTMHLEIIRFLRKYYEEYDYLPTLRRACKVSGDGKESCLRPPRSCEIATAF